MSKARAGKELHIVAENRIGTLSEISQWLADKGINIRAVSAYVDADKAHFVFITSDNKKAMEILRAREMQPQEQEVVIVEMLDKIGMLKDAAKKLKAADVDITNIYGTATNNPTSPGMLVLDTSNNRKAISLING